MSLSERWIGVDRKIYFKVELHWLKNGGGAGNSTKS